MEMGYMIMETWGELFVSWNHGSLWAARIFGVAQSNPVSAAPEPLEECSQF